MALHRDVLTLIRRLHLLALCRLAVQLAHWRCPPRLPAGAGGRLRVYCEECLLLLALLRTLWQLSYQDLHDWLVSWPALALACGLPLGEIGRPAARALSILTMEAGGERRLICAHSSVAARASRCSSCSRGPTPTTPH